METVIVGVLAILAVLFVLSQGREEWRALRRRRDREHMRHVIGARSWWGRGR